MNYGVITACLNSASTIRLTIDSVLKQSIPPKEYIFVDGGSTDGTLSIIDEKIQQSHNDNLGIDFKLIHQNHNRGIYEAWNMALQNFHSEIVFILNSDDWYILETAENVLSCFRDNPLAGIVIGSGCYKSAPEDLKSLICHNRSFLALPLAMPIIHPACFVKRNVYDQIGLFDARYKVSADYDFVYRCVKAGIIIKTYEKVLVNVLLGGFSGKNRQRARRETYEIARRHCMLPFMPTIAYLIRCLINR